MNGHEDGSGSGSAPAFDRLREALDAAREAVRRAERAVEEAEREGSDRPAELRIDGPTWTWRERLWAAPAETRIGVRELVEALDVSESWVYARTKREADDPIPHRKLGGTLQFIVGEVRHWIRSHEEAPVQGPMWTPAGDGLGVVDGGAT